MISDTSGLVETLLAVSGQGTLPGIATTPSTLSFGSLPLGTASDAQTVTTGNGFTMQGGSAEISGQFWRGLGAAADVTGLHTSTMNSSAAGLDLVTVTFGPRYTWPRNRFAVFGQALVGNANGMNSIFPSAQGANSSGNSFALEVGGGIDRAVSRHLSLRVAELDWLRTQLPNGTSNIQNNLKCAIGLVYRTKTKPG